MRLFRGKADEPAATGRDGDRPSRRRRNALLWCSIVVLIVYVLSSGPVVRIFDGPGNRMTRTGAVYAGMQLFYSPLAWLNRHVRWIEVFYDAEFRLCGAKDH